MARQPKIRWISHPWLSSVHAAASVSGQRECIDASVEQALIRPVTELNNRLLSHSIDVAAFWRELVHAVANEHGARPPRSAEKQSCDSALLAAGVNEFQIDGLRSTVLDGLRQCQTAFEAKFPRLVDQLELRGRPLRQAFEAYGPGLLRDIATKIWAAEPPDDWWSTSIDVLLVQPIVGGEGRPASQCVWVEAILTDADPTIPEVTRLAFLITRLAVGQYLRQKSGGVESDLPWTAASCAITLAAASELNLVGKVAPSIPRAVQLWGLDCDPKILASWWGQFADSPEPMPIALRNLKKQLGTSEAGKSLLSGPSTPRPGTS